LAQAATLKIACNRLGCIAPLAALLCGVLSLVMLSSAVAIAKEPKVPVYRDPGGVAVAMLGHGVNYTHKTIARRLARDGEGDPIGWDFADNDIRPFAKNGLGTANALIFLEASSRGRLILIKQASTDAVAVGRMISFATQTPARIIILPDAALYRADLPVLKRAALHFPQHLFIAPYGPKNFTAPNLLVSAPRVAKSNSLNKPAGNKPAGNSSWTATLTFTPRITALHLAARAADLWAESPKLTAAEVKMKLLAE